MSIMLDRRQTLAPALLRPERRRITLAPAPPKRPMTRQRKEQLLLGAVMTFTAVLAMRLRNTAFIDEALYINAGHAQLDHWLNGTPLGDAGAYFSGAPALYPVLAALLDSMGGLYLVRAFSLLCVLATAVALRSIARALWGPRAGLLTATTFLLVGPVVFVSWLGTFDALTMLLLTTGLWLGLTRQGQGSAALMGLVLTLATLIKYTAGVFVPVVLILTALVGSPRQPSWAALRRAVAACAVVLMSLAGLWYRWSDALVDDIEFTTTQRTALTPVSSGLLVDLVVDHFLLLLPLALMGIYAMFRRSTERMVLAGLVMLGAACMLPLAQLRLGEAVSFEKHLAYSALFLSLLIGYALARLSRRPLATAPVVLVVLAMSLFAMIRGSTMYAWTSVQPVITALEMRPVPGLYISSAADTLDYHTRDLEGVAWATTFELYFEGEEAIRQAVKAERYQTVILRSASVGNADQDESQATFIEALQASSAYALAFEPFPAGAPGANWLIYTRR